MMHAGTAIDGVKLYNGGDSDATFSWRVEGNGWQEEMVKAGEVVDRQAIHFGTV
jgi:hypothetical protein